MFPEGRLAGRGPCGRQDVWGNRDGLGAIEVDVGQAMRRGAELDADILRAAVKEAWCRRFIDDAFLPVPIEGRFLLEGYRYRVPTTPNVVKRDVDTLFMMRRSVDRKTRGGDLPS